MSSEEGLRQEIVDTVNELFSAGLISATGGNVSARVTDEEDTFLVTPTMSFKGGLKPADIVKVNGKGKARDRRQRPSVETAVHLSVYVAYPEIEAVIHSHAGLSIALGLVNGSIPPFSVDALPFTTMKIVPYQLSGTPELCVGVVQALEHSPAVLLQSHGLLTVGWTLRQAANRAEALEEVLQVLLACRAFGKEPVTLPPETVELLRAAGAV